MTKPNAFCKWLTRFLDEKGIGWTSGPCRTLDLRLPRSARIFHRCAHLFRGLIVCLRGFARSLATASRTGDFLHCLTVDNARDIVNSLLCDRQRKTTQEQCRRTPYAWLSALSPIQDRVPSSFTLCESLVALGRGGKYTYQSEFVKRASSDLSIAISTPVGLARLSSMAQLPAKGSM